MGARCNRFDQQGLFKRGHQGCSTRFFHELANHIAWAKSIVVGRLGVAIGERELNGLDFL